MAAQGKHSAVVIEALESRRFLSSSILGPSAVEGHFKGDLVYDGITKEVKLTVTATSETLTVVGEGSKTVTESSKEFVKLRKGSFYWSGTVKGVTVTFAGSVSSDGDRISGSASARESSGASLSGTFVLKKY